MDVQTIINPSVQAIRVVDLQKGTVFKRVVKKYSDEYQLKFGVVIDIMKSDKTFIEVAEIEKSYGSSSIKLDIIGEHNKELNLYPATKEEFKDYFGDVTKGFEKSIQEKEGELKEAKAKYQLFKDLTDDKFVKIEDSKTQVIEA